jgi:hypothetical protein
MKIQLETRAVVIGVVAVISVLAIVGLAQTSTPTPCPKEELPFHLVMRCVQEKDFPQLVGAIKGVPTCHKRIQIDTQPFDGGLPTPAPEPQCLGGDKTNSNVTQRVAFVNKTDLDTFIKDAGL